MNPHDVFLEARKRGLRLQPAGDKLAVTPKGACPPDFAAVLREHKGELLRWLNSPPCPGRGAVPPDSLPLVPVEAKPTPEARQLLIAYLLRQGANRPGKLAEWLVRRECAYYDGPGRKWDCASFSYAAARDAACSQMACNESELLSRLETFDTLSHSKPA